MEQKKERGKNLLCTLSNNRPGYNRRGRTPGSRGRTHVPACTTPRAHLPLPRDHVLSHRISASVPAETQSYFRHVGPRRDSNQTDSTVERAITNFLPRLRRQDVPLQVCQRENSGPPNTQLGTLRQMFVVSVLRFIAVARSASPAESRSDRHFE